MTLTRRFGLLCALGLALSACAATPPAPQPPTAPVTLISAFAGHRTGNGQFRVWLTGDARRFTAVLNGTVKGAEGSQTLTVTEDFVYDDGQKDRLTWVFVQTGPGLWSGKREDTVGAARVIEAQGQIRLTYTADFKSLSGTTRLGFADVIYAQPDGTIINDGIVSRAGFPVAGVRFVIR